MSSGLWRMQGGIHDYDYTIFAGIMGMLLYQFLVYITCLFRCRESLYFLYFSILKYLSIGCWPNSSMLFELVQPHLLRYWCGSLMSRSFPRLSPAVISELGGESLSACVSRQRG